MVIALKQACGPVIVGEEAALGVDSQPVVEDAVFGKRAGRPEFSVAHTVRPGVSAAKRAWRAYRVNAVVPGYATVGKSRAESCRACRQIRNNSAEAPYGAERLSSIRCVRCQVTGIWRSKRAARACPPAPTSSRCCP